MTIILCAAAQHCLGQKVSFWSDSLCFFMAASSKQCVLTPATFWYPLCHDPPSPLAPGGSNYTGEHDRPMSRDWSQSLRSSYVTFIDESNKSFILLTILLCAEDRRALGQKVSFWSDNSCFFHGRFVKMTRTDPSYSFLPQPPESSLHFSMILD